MLLKFTEGSYYVSELLIDTEVHIFSTEENLGYPGIHVTSLQNLKLFMALSALVHNTGSYILIRTKKRGLKLVIH